MTNGSLRAIELSLDAIEAPPLRLLYAYWREATAGRPLLVAKELRPERFAPALQHIAIVERLEAPRAGLRIRLCGADMENKDFGIVRGAYIEDVKPGWYRDHLVAETAGAVKRAIPLHQRVEAEIDGQRHAFTRLFLPLSSDGRTCDQLIVASIRPSEHLVSAMRVRLSLA
jgi:hypothetical protein